MYISSKFFFIGIETGQMCRNRSAGNKPADAGYCVFRNWIGTGVKIYPPPPPSFLSFLSSPLIRPLTFAFAFWGNRMKAAFWLSPFWVWRNPLLDWYRISLLILEVAPPARVRLQGPRVRLREGKSWIQFSKTSVSKHFFLWKSEIIT